MNNQVERFRIEPEGDIQGGWVFFDWATGHMNAKWDDGQAENWPPRGYSLDAKAKSFFLFTEQWERYLAAA